MRRFAPICLSVLIAAASLPATSAAGSARGPSFDCGRASRPAEKAVCADATLSGLDRLLARAYALAATGDRAPAVKAEQRRWLTSRDGAVSASGDTAPLARLYEERLRALIAAAGPRAMAAAAGAAHPIDPLHAAPPGREEDTAFVAFVLTTLLGVPASEDDLEPAYARYAGFTDIGRLADGRLLISVPDFCGAYQCATVPILLDPAAGTAVRAGVEVPGGTGMPVRDPAAMPLGLVSVGDYTVTIRELARGAGDCGTIWTYQAGTDTLHLVRQETKEACDGAEWGPANTQTRTYR